MKDNNKDFFDEAEVKQETPNGAFRNTTLLIDADIIAFQSAATCDGREYEVSYSTGLGNTRTFKYHKDAKIQEAEWVGMGFIDVTIDLLYKPELEVFAIRNVNASIGVLKKKFPGIKMEFFLTGDSNFRHDLVDDYKANRKDKRRPHHLKACKDLILKKYGGVIIEGMEADDLLGCRQVAMCKAGKSSIIASIDKDLLTIPGEHYNWRKDLHRTIEPLEAKRFFYSQCLQGDSTDNIKGLKGIGPAKASKILKDSESEYEMYDAVRTSWLKSFFPGFFNEEEKCNMDKGECRKRLEEVVLDLHRSASLLYILHEPMVMWSVPQGTRQLTEAAQADSDDFEGYFESGCICHTGHPPCSWCVHPGNPLSLEGDEGAWEVV